MKIVYLYQFFTTPRWPGATRAFEFARRLVAQGHEVRVITSNAGWTGMRLKGGESIPKGITEEDGIEVHWLDIPYSNKMGFVRRIFAFLMFSIRAMHKALFLDADLIFATSPPLTIGIPAVIAGLFRRKPLIFEVRDRWPEAAIQLGVLQNPILIRLAEGMERMIYRRADAIIALTPGIKEEIERSGVPPQKISVIPNSCDLELFDNPAGPIDRGGPFDFGDRFVLTYCGVHGPANGLGYLLECAKACTAQGLKNVLILFVGDGKEKESLEGRAKKEGIENVEFRDPIPKTDIPKLFAASDVGLTIFKDLPILRTCSPNKYFDTLAAGRPVLTNMAGWLSDLVLEQDAGAYCDPNDPSDFVRTILPWIEDRAKWREACQQARILGEEQFSRNLLAKKLESVFVDLVNRKSENS